jgi:hypothetical protein
LCDPDHKEYVKSPPIGKAWYDTIPELIDEIEALERASRNKEQRQFPTDVIELVSKAKHALVHKKDKLEDERVAKRRCLLEINNSSHSSSNSEEATTGSDGCDGIDGENNGDDEEEATSNGDNKEATSGPKPPQLAPGFNIWWDSEYAQRLFNSCKERETVVDRHEDLIILLDNANAMALSYKTIVKGNDADDTMSEYKKESK